MRWCRLYTETPSDPKLRRIARQAGTTVANVLAVWTSMLCHAACNDGEAWGTLAGWDDLDVAINLDLDRGVIVAIRREMEQRVTLDGRILKWSDRQARNDHSAERMRQWRARRAQKQDTSPGVTSRSVTVTQSDGKKRREEKREDRATLYPSRAVRAVGAVPAPDWLDAGAWSEWCRYRQGRKWTSRAAELSLKKLMDLRDAGHDPRVVIEQSIANGWTGLFAINAPRSSGKPESKMSWLIRDMLGDKPQ